MVGEYRFLLHRLCQRAQCKLAYKLPSAAFLLQRYAFLLKEARNYWKMFESEGDKKKKVYPACPILWGKKDTPYSFYSPLISCSVKPVIKAICSILNPLANILRAMSFFSLVLPSSIPSNLAFPKTSF